MTFYKLRKFMWQINFEDYLKRLNCSSRKWKQELLLPHTEKVKKIVPLRTLAKIESIMPISKRLLLHTIRQIQTFDGEYPFKNADIKMLRIDPEQLLVGQKYIYRENYSHILENLSRTVFSNFCVTDTLSNLGAYFVFGYDTSNNSQDEELCLALYIPPLIEKHNLHLVIMDGIHRNYLIKQVGTTINSILIENVEVAFPCSVESWQKTKVISLKEKPLNLEDRYFKMNKNLFRDLKHLGIDG